MAMEPNSNMGIPGLVLLGIGTFLKMAPGFMPANLQGWLMSASYAAAIIYYLFKIISEYKNRKQ